MPTNNLAISTEENLAYQLASIAVKLRALGLIEPYLHATISRESLLDIIDNRNANHTSITGASLPASALPLSATIAAGIENTGVTH